MAVTYATVTKAPTGPGPVRRFSFYPQTEGNIVTVAAENYEHAGPFEVTAGASGAFTIALPTGTDQGGATLLWKIVETPVDKIPGRSGGGLAPLAIGYSTINASIDYDDLIAGLVDAIVVTPDLASGVAANAAAAADSETNASGYADAALASAADAATDADLAEAARIAAEANANGFSAGTATSLAPGATPTLSITGTAPSRQLNLGIPAGLADDASMEAVRANPASAFAQGLSATIATETAGKVDAGDPETAATLAPLYVETLSTGLAYSSPTNLRTGLSSATMTGGGYAVELEIAVTGTKGSAILTTTETTKVAGLGSNPFAAVLNSADGLTDIFATVLSHNGSAQITLRKALDADFTGTLSAKYDEALGQHLTQAGTRAYIAHALEATGLLSSRGRIMAGCWDSLPPVYNTIWAKNAALTAYGVTNSAAPVVQTTMITPSDAINVNGVDKLSQAPTSLSAGIQVGTRAAGHGADGTLYPARRETVLEFFTAAYRSGTSVAGAQIAVTVTGDGRTLYSKTHDGWLTKVAVPLHGIDKVTVSVTNADGGTYYIMLTQTTLREAGVGGRNKSPLRKIVLLGDSWFARYDGLAGDVLAEKTGATVVNNAQGGQTSEWGLSWFDTYVLAEKPDECWLHFFTNDSNDLSADTFTTPTGGTQAKWPAGLTETQAIARWRANMLELIERCRAAGIKPVVFLPGGTASDGQTAKHAKWSWNLDNPALLDWAAASITELADATAYVNNVGKTTGAKARVGTAMKYANGPLAADAWANQTDDALEPLQKASLSRANYAMSTGVVIGTDTNADGLSDGLTVTGYGTKTGDTYTPSIVSGNQRYAVTYANPQLGGNNRVTVTFTAVAGKRYLAVFDIINATPSVAMGDCVSNIDGTSRAFSSTSGGMIGGATTIAADGTGVVCVQATATVGSKTVSIAHTPGNGLSRTYDIRKVYVIDVTALLAVAPNLASKTTAELAAFVLAMAA